MCASTQANSALRKMDYELMWDPCYGYLSSCPSNLGTGLVASVGIRLPMLSGRPELLRNICDEYCLESHPSRQGSIQDETPVLIVTTQRVFPPRTSFNNPPPPSQLQHPALANLHYH